MAGENFGEFVESGGIHQSFIRSNLHKNCGLTRKIQRAKTCRAYVYLNVLSSSEAEAGSPRSQWPLKEKAPPAAIAAANAKVVEAIDR